MQYPTYRTISSLTLALTLSCLGASPSHAQGATKIESLGPVLARSSEPLASVSQVRPASGGRVIVNDNRARRLLLFDSTLNLLHVMLDSASGATNSYGASMGGLMTYTGDSTLFVDPGALAMLVIDGNGSVTRTMAAPREAPVMVGGPFGTPGVDGRGRLIYRMGVQTGTVAMMIARGERPCQADSALIVRRDMTSRQVDTLTRFAISKICVNYTQGARGAFTFTPVVNPAPLTDDWALLADGTIAVVRGREYRVDFFHADGTTKSGPRVPFDWERFTDEAKTALVDSVNRNIAELRATQSVPGAGSAPIDLVPISEIPEYRPAFGQGAAHGDADGHLWARTSKYHDGGSVYDVIDANGILVKRVAVPHGRVIAGFGPGGVVYMGVLDGSIARLERARVP